MKTKQVELRLAPPLPTVLRELAERLIADDWVRYATADDSSAYYIVGLRAHATDEASENDHLVVCVPRREKVSVIGERQVHAQVASTKPGDYYLRRARRQLEATGIQPGEVDRFIDMFDRGEDFIPVVVRWQIRERNRFEAFSNLLHALALRLGANVGQLASQSERRDALDEALEKLYLEEVSRLFESIVARAGPLEALEFNDPQLNEASRCFLYGFFRGAVVLCASALETNLRTAVGPLGVRRIADQTRTDNGRRRGFFDLLVDEADSLGGLGSRQRPGQEPPLVLYSRKIFEDRTKVVHKGLVPTKELAEELLTKSRQVIEHICRNTMTPRREPSRQ